MAKTLHQNSCRYKYSLCSVYRNIFEAPEKLSQVWFNAKTTPLGDSEVTSMTSLFTPVWTAAQLADDAVPKDVVCFLGSAENLGDNIASVNGGGGRDCGAPNGCGVHVHAGTSCDTTETQGT